jgi:hypothetical protein
MKMWIFNCQHVAQLVSESMDHKLSPGRRLGMRFHLLMCKHCARYKKQLYFIRQLISNNSSLISDSSPTTMDESAKKRLRQILSKSDQSKD